MARITITPEKLQESAERYEDYVKILQNLINTMEIDKNWMFPPFNGANPTEERFDTLIHDLQKCSDSLQSFSEFMRRTLKTIEIPDEALINAFTL